MGWPGLRAFAAAASRGAQSLLGIEPGRRTGHDVCRILLGSVLLTAAALKAHQALTEPADGGGFFDSHGLALAIVEFEVLLGVAMLSGLFRRFTWAVSALCFAGFACASLWKGLSNAPSCGCFGAVPVNPWYTFALDVAAVFALMRWRPGVASNAPYRMHAEWLRLLGAGCAALFVAVVWWWFRTAGAIVANQGLAVAPAALDLGEIWVHGLVRPLPEHLLLGAGPLGATLEGTVTLSTLGQPFKVCDVRCSGQGMSASPVDSPARSEFGTVRTYRVSQRIVECGMREEKVSFACAREDGVAEVVFVNVSYQGAEAAALAGN